jgi:hypothetical protein
MPPPAVCSICGDECRTPMEGDPPVCFKCAHFGSPARAEEVEQFGRIAAGAHAGRPLPESEWDLLDWRERAVWNRVGLAVAAEIRRDMSAKAARLLDAAREACGVAGRCPHVPRDGGRPVHVERADWERLRAAVEAIDRAR